MWTSYAVLALSQQHERSVSEEFFTNLKTPHIGAGTNTGSVKNKNNPIFNPMHTNSSSWKISVQLNLLNYLWNLFFFKPNTITKCRCSHLINSDMTTVALNWTFMKKIQICPMSTTSYVMEMVWIQFHFQTSALAPEIRHLNPLWNKRRFWACTDITES